MEETIVQRVTGSAPGIATVSNAYPVTPSAVEAIVTWPLETAVATPVELLIVATLGLRLAQVNVFPLIGFPLASRN